MQQWSRLRDDGLPLSDFTRDHDPYTLRHLASLEMPEGSSCLDVGAGSGSVARWLGERVGDGGRVVAVDVDAGPLEEGLNGTRAEVRILDVAQEALPEGEFDLVHSRLMLCNMLERDDVLERLVAATKPGGTLVLADLDFTTHRPVFAEPAWNRAWPAFMGSLGSAGWDPAFGRRLVPVLEQAGLANVQAESVTRYVRGGSLTCRMTARALERAAHVSDDLTAEDIAQLRPALDDPARAFVAPEFTIAWGTRPLAAA